VRTNLLVSFLFLSGSAVCQQSGTSISDILEEQLRAVVTVEVSEVSDVPRAYFGAAIDGQTSPAKINPYSHSLFFTNAQLWGSGFLIQRGTKYYVVTNVHVIERASAGTIQVVSVTGERYKMTVLGADTIRDIAVLEFSERPGKEVKALSFRTTAVRVGEPVYALGNPAGRFPSSVSNGIVSGLNRQGTSSAAYIQSTAMLTGGNSGGPLIDSRGQVVGVNTWVGKDKISTGDPKYEGKFSSTNKQLNFSLSSLVAGETVSNIIETGRVKRGSLGIHISAIEVDGQMGFFISDVLSSLPEATRKLLSRQILTHVDDVMIRDPLELFALLDRVKPGQTVKLRLVDAKEKSFEVPLTASELTDERLAQVVGAYLRTRLGVSIARGGKDVTVQIATAKDCTAQAVRVKSTSEGRQEKALESIPSQLNLLAAGTSREDDSVVYPLAAPRAFLMIARRMALEGGLTLFGQGADDSVDVVTLSAHIGKWPVATILH